MRLINADNYIVVKSKYTDVLSPLQTRIEMEKSTTE